MNRRPEPSPGQEGVQRWLSQHQRGLVDGLMDVLDTEAGLSEVLLQSRHDAAVEGLADVLDVETGLREALGVRTGADTPVPPPVPLPVSRPQLWSYKEIAAHIRVKPETVHSYRKHGLLPPPDMVEGGRPYWFAEAILAWTAGRAACRRGDVGE